MPGRIEFGFALHEAPAGARRRAEDAPFRLLLVADFGGRASRAVADVAGLATRRTHRVDLDNFDAVLARIAPRVAIDAFGPPLELAFQSLEDFHPDRLIAAVPALRTLDETRRRLQDPATFAAAAAALAPAAAENDRALLGRLLGAAPAAAAPPAPSATPEGTVDALIRRIVAPHIVPEAAPQQAAYVAGANAALADALRTLLHHPALQRVEAAWRGVQLLVTGLELDEPLQLHLLDATREELQADLAAAGARGEWAASGLHQALVQRSRERGEAWSMIALDLECGPGAADLALLAALGAVGAFCGAPVLAGAAPALLGRADFAGPAASAAPLAAEDAARWQALRSSPLAPWLGVAAPRLLMRRPYGVRSDPVEHFAFEELGAAPGHGEYLWGPPAYACALLAARAYAAAGWAGDPNEDRVIADLPAVTIERDGERELLPCAEGWLGDEAAQAMLAAGVMPLVAARHRNAVQVLRVQSIADPPRALGGG